MTSTERILYTPLEFPGEEPRGSGVSGEHPYADELWPRLHVRWACPVFWSPVSHYIWIMFDVACVVFYAWMTVKPPEFFQESFHDFGLGRRMPNIIAAIISAQFLTLAMHLVFARKTALNNSVLHEMLRKMRQQGQNPSHDEVRPVGKLSLAVVMGWLVCAAVLLKVTLGWEMGTKFFVYSLWPVITTGTQFYTASMPARVVADCCRYEVETFIKTLEEVAEGSMLKDGFWKAKTREHMVMDNKMEDVVDINVAGIYLCFVLELLLFMLAGFCGVMGSSVAATKLVLVCGTTLAPLFASYYCLSHPAEVTELCRSKKKNRKSVHRAASRFFAWQAMSDRERLDHSIFMQYLDTTSHGFEAPWVGVITIEFITTQFKVVLTALPIVVSYVLAYGD